MLFSGRGGRVRCALVLCDRPGRLRKQRRAADFAVQKGYRSFLAASTNLRFSSFYNIKQHKPDYNRACVVAEVAGFEPTHAGIKIPCLTAWRHLYIIQFKRQRWQGTLRRHFFDRSWRCPKKIALLETSQFDLLRNSTASPNLRMRESKSRALPLGDTSMYFRMARKLLCVPLF